MPKKTPETLKTYQMITKYRAPNQLDHAEYGTLLQALTGHDAPEYYLQTSKDESKPDWKSIDSVAALAFKEFFCDPDFITFCLGLLEGRNKECLQEFLMRYDKK